MTVHVGVLLGADTPENLPAAAMNLDFPVAHTMPCGEHFVAWSAKDVPLTDVPCPCGDPSHWLVKVQVGGENEY